MNHRTLAMAVAALLASGGLAQALDLGIGDVGVSINTDNGVSISTGGGDSSVGVNVGGSGDSLASVSTGTGNGVDEGANLSINNTNGSLVTLDRDNNAGNTNGNVNLGGATGGLNGLIGGLGGIGGTGGNGGNGGSGGPGGKGTGGFGPGGGGGGGTAAVLFANMTPAQQQQLVNRCVDVMARPRNYDTDLVNLCRFLGSINTTGATRR